jgi:lycopene cyclase domain-containing protein
MNPHLTYFLILAGSVAAPLLLSFDSKVAFYRKWKYVFAAMVFPALLYILWDIYFTSKGVWGFNNHYITGIRFINLPVEEVLFFFIVPYCCLFIYECIYCYFPLLRRKASNNKELLFLAVLLFISGVIFIQSNILSGLAC